MDPDLNPVTNPDAQEALSRKYSNRTLILLPLDSGAVAIFDRSFGLHLIVNDNDENISYDQLRSLSKVFFTQLTSRKAEASYYGEPDDRQYAKDLKTVRTPKFERRGKPLEDLAVDIEL